MTPAQQDKVRWFESFGWKLQDADDIGEFVMLTFPQIDGDTSKAPFVVFVDSTGVAS